MFEKKSDQVIVLQVDLNPGPWVIVESKEPAGVSNKGLLVLVQLEFKEILLPTKFSVISLMGLHFSLHYFINVALGALTFLNSRLSPCISLRL